MIDLAVFQLPWTRDHTHEIHVVRELADSEREIQANEIDGGGAPNLLRLLIRKWVEAVSRQGKNQAILPIHWAEEWQVVSAYEATDGV
jgi:hypothetical protein